MLNPIRPIVDLLIVASTVATLAWGSSQLYHFFRDGVVQKLTEKQPSLGEYTRRLIGHF